MDAPGLASTWSPLLLRALLACLTADVLSVRDAACVAVGKCVTACPQQCAPQLDAIFGHLLELLSDPVWSVREDSAVALDQVNPDPI